MVLAKEPVPKFTINNKWRVIMSEKIALSKRITMRLPVTVLEKIPMFSANSINQYVRDAIIEKTQREAMSQHELTTQVARIANAIETLSNTMANMTINTNMPFAQENLCSQETKEGVTATINNNDEYSNDAEYARMMQEMVTASAFNILNNGWGNASNDEK